MNTRSAHKRWNTIITQYDNILMDITDYNNSDNTDNFFPLHIIFYEIQSLL